MFFIGPCPWRQESKGAAASVLNLVNLECEGKGETHC